MTSPVVLAAQRSRSPAWAIAWEFRQRHRWGLIGLGVYLVALASLKIVVIASGPIKLDSPESFALAVVVPIAATMTYFLAVFTYGLDGDLAARQSMYPARMLALPVTTAGLAGWPMLYGTLAMATLWLVTRLLALWPSGLEVPVIWPALLAAALLAWTQALTWMPYGFPGLRLAAAVLCLTALDAVVLVALYSKAREPVMIAILAPQVPLAYFVAHFAVARARRGEVPDWRGVFAWWARLVGVARKRQRNFPGPARAQAWYEWRRSGRSLPTWVAILLPLELALLRLAGDNTPLVLVILLGVLVTPIVMAVFAAASVRKSNSLTRDAYGVTPFDATRPLTSAGLVAAKLTVTIWSTAAAWVLVLGAIPIGLMLTGRTPVVIARADRLAVSVGTLRAVVIVVLLVVGSIAATWKQLVNSMYIGLTGRERIIKGSLFVTLSLLFLIGPISQWLIERKHLGELWDALPLILFVLVGVKLFTAVWVVRRLDRARLLSDRTLVTGAASWCAAVLGLYGVLVWFMDTPFFPRYVLALVAILAFPLARLSAAPLALAWNRHR